MQGTQELLGWILGRRARQGQEARKLMGCRKSHVGAGQWKLKLGVLVATVGVEVGEMTEL